MSSSIRDCLARLARSNDPDTRSAASAISDYLETRDPSHVARIPPGASTETGQPAALAINECPDHPDAAAMLELVAILIGRERYRDPLIHPQHGCGFGNVAFSYMTSAAAQKKAVEALIDAAHRITVSDFKIARYLLLEHGSKLEYGWIPCGKDLPMGWDCDPRLFEPTAPLEWNPVTPMEKLVWSLSDRELDEIACATLDPTGRSNSFTPPPVFFGLLARFRPSALDTWVTRSMRGEGFNLRNWQLVLAATREFDDRAVKLSENLEPLNRLSLLLTVTGKSPDQNLEPVRLAALATGKEGHATAMTFLADHFPGDLAIRMERSIVLGELDRKIPRFVYEKSFKAMTRLWSGAGRAVFESIPAAVLQPTGSIWGEVGTPSLHSHAIGALVEATPSPPIGEIREWVSKAVESIVRISDKKLANSCLEAFWHAVVSRNPAPLREELFALLGDKLKTLRQLAVEGLAAIADPGIVERAKDLINLGKLDQKLGASSLLSRVGNDTCVEALHQALTVESNEKARVAFHQALKEFQSRSGTDQEVVAPANMISLAELESSFAKQTSKLKAPTASWLKLESLPALPAHDGPVLSPLAVVVLLAKQSKHKTLDAAPDILPLLAHIDREKSPPFALALVEGFLNSEQAASDRWALALGGLLGDKRIIPPLLSRIPDWCENSRHKLAEYAAQAIALLPGNEPLMVLDSLSNRYRSKFKNVGKACAEAFNAAAAARGITADELGDMVVPDFGFDGDGIRRFEWDGGGASAELGADFKLSWFDPDTDKAWKSLPANAPAAVKDEVKTLGKLLREAVKAQTARLEMTLVRQRRWPVARWRELFENHPLLRSFASSLVWGIYDVSGTLLRTFRRYPNGLLANAAGELEELPEADTMIGMVHPLELETAALDAWRAHLGRFKVKQPFPQIDRPVELMDPLHGNRREIALTKGGKVNAGTFRSRSEKRGWTRGSVVDAGGISSYYKLYPGAGVEVVLPTDNFYIGIDPMETVELGAAYFATAGSVERGSYTYDEPAPDDPRVLRFDQVPAVVWSETMSDLKAILGT